MALVQADRVKETASAPGTGAVTLLGASTGFQAFSAVLAISDTCFYTITTQGGADWEVGIGTYSGVNTLTRTSVLSSSNSGSTTNFSSGTQDVFITYPAGKAVTNPQAESYAWFFS